jgi:hypothetical protein
MSIQGSGKVSGGFSSRPAATDRPRRAAEKRQAREATQAKGTAPAQVKPDTFETANQRLSTLHTPAGANLPVGAGLKLDDLVGHPSQIKQLAEALGAHTRRLTTEFDALRAEAQAVVGDLAKQGFSPQAVGERRTDLGALRKQMAQLRGKIAADGRRLKLLKAEASKLGESRLSDKLTNQLKRIADMERGWGRAFLALGIAGTISAVVDGEPGAVTRLPLGVGSTVDRHALGGYLANTAPGTAASQLLVSLLEEGPHGPPARLLADAYAELHADVLAGRFGKALQGLGVWRQAMG